MYDGTGESMIYQVKSKKEYRMSNKKNEGFNDEQVGGKYI